MGGADDKTQDWWVKGLFCNIRYRPPDKSAKFIVLFHFSTKTKVVKRTVLSSIQKLKTNV